MIKVIGNDFMRGGEKIGWIEGDHIFDHTGRKLGYASGNNIYDIGGMKIGWIEGDYLFAPGNKKIRLDEVHAEIQGGVLTEAQRAAVRVLLGD